MRLSEPERSTLAEIGKRLGRTALQQVACVAKPDTILAWYCRLIARKFDGSKQLHQAGHQWRPKGAEDRRIALELVTSRPFKNGCVLVTYRVNHRGDSR